ncbi:tetratricopeptide repeat protein [Williamwhitmania taraxaci]|uniref:Tetratricopeptide repeat-containing protein n=1 Tax=Williamwhitmania taraxaci TaxID=1640674 RepID=A0A1G6PIU9_9BACT|nr:tetratricopeptide repeat protein [Williamwhitmania taraxaci]SDC80172.1 Tetratricopeptide repeat-containing protein [Williamwhitmania taraxaci]
MATNYNAIRLLEKRIDGTISKDEANWLAQRLAVDFSLRREFRFRKELESIVGEVEIDRLRQRLAVAWQENNSLQSTHQENLQRFSRFKRYFYAAATLAGIAAGGLAMHATFLTKETPVALYAQHFEPYPPVRIVRTGGGLSSESHFFRGMIAYQGGFYATAADDFESLVKGGDTSVTVKFYLGLSYMELGRFAEARQSLEHVTTSGSLFVDQSVWYLALCHLAEENSEAAQKLLVKLATSDSPMSAKATALLTEMHK